jgi:hypothetical protein
MPGSNRIGKGLLAVGAILLTFSLSAGEKPNIVFMMADNLGYGDLGCYGGGEVRGMPTPRIDKLASEGIRFTQFLVEPGCTPSRAACMTGRYAIRCGLSLVVLRGTPNTLRDQEVTMAEVLKDVGYNTAYLGKWHLGMEPISQPQNQGFDSYYGILNSTDEALFAASMKRAGYKPTESEKAYVWQGANRSRSCGSGRQLHSNVGQEEGPVFSLPELDTTTLPEPCNTRIRGQVHHRPLGRQLHGTGPQYRRCPGRDQECRDRG